MLLLNLKVAEASFYEAEIQCQKLDAHLVSIHSEEEYDYIKSELTFQYDLLLNCCCLKISIPANVVVHYKL